MKYYCLGNGALKCNGCGTEHTWFMLNQMSDKDRLSLQSSMTRVDDTECILKGRPYHTSTIVSLVRILRLCSS